ANLEIRDHVAEIRLQRASKRNALKRDFIEQLTESVDQVTSNANIRVLLISAEGTVFCAGMDLGEMQKRATSNDGKQQWRKDSEVYAELLSKLFYLDIPTVVKLQGPVLAGGVGLVLACDFIIASETAFFMLPEPMRGITAAMVTPFLVYRAGGGSATHLLLSGERLSAVDSRTVGLSHDVVEETQLDSRVDSLIASILTGSRSALAITKKHVQNCVPLDLKQHLQNSINISAEARETQDAREGLSAFLEKRKPNWQPE
ncbi:MAG: enoyl-CoA hydratase-related protein, partial [Planctomycetota bacterium]